MFVPRFARIVQCASLVLGPVLMGVSTFFWTTDGRQGVVSGTLTALGATVWLYGLLGMWDVVRERRPVWGVLGSLLTIVGTLGGIAFGLQGFFEQVFEVDKERSLAALEPHPIASALVFWLPGPAFPAAVAGLGIALLLIRIGPRWIGPLLIVSGLLFPLSRIPRIAAAAHAIDLLLFVASAALGLWLLRRARAAQPPPNLTAHATR